LSGAHSFCCLLHWALIRDSTDGWLLKSVALHNCLPGVEITDCFIVRLLIALLGWLKVFAWLTIFNANARFLAGLVGADLYERYLDLVATPLRGRNVDGLIPD
jgi:hypothetical protein